jgi:hypothetical protein
MHSLERLPEPRFEKLFKEPVVVLVLEFLEGGSHLPRFKAVSENLTIEHAGADNSELFYPV